MAFVLSEGKFVLSEDKFALATPAGETWVVKEEYTTGDEQIFTGLDYDFNYVTQDEPTTYLTKLNQDTFSCRTESAGRLGNYYAWYTCDSQKKDAPFTFSNKKTVGGEPAFFYSSPETSEEAFTARDAGVILALRTLHFNVAPTGDLLTWLQANAVKQ